MGQQQLLLLVLATVIVGLATVAGIQAFDQGQTRANQDALNQSSVKIASDIQANLQKPEQFGGAGLDTLSEHSASDTPKLQSIGYQTESSSSAGVDFSTEKGDYWKNSDGDCGISANSDGTIKVTCASADNRIRTEITSLNSGGITQDTSYTEQ
jgi:hypothetical protein